MACVGCATARFETIADAAREYHVDLRSLLNDLRMTGRPRSRQRKARDRGDRRPSSHNHGVHKAG